MIDSILLAPYWLSLKLRHLMFDRGIRKVHRSGIPSVCIGNITVGGTGKTPHTEMLLGILKEHPVWKDLHIAVLSRGYRRRSSGFQVVDTAGTAEQYGDEPMQIKKKFPDTVVAVDKDRIEGCRLLEEGVDGQAGADLVILDDAFQYRSLKADFNIVLMDYGRPVYKDHLLPLGRLRDLPERVSAADVVIVTKCPAYLDEWRRGMIAENLGFGGEIFFTKTSYDELKSVFPEGDPRYIHSQRLILFSGIANDSPMMRYLGDSYRIVRHISFSDHHRFSSGDIERIGKAAAKFPTAVIVTTEKDSQRILDCKDIPDRLKERMFYLPIRSEFISGQDKDRFIQTFEKYISPSRQGHHSAPGQTPRV